MIQPSSDKFACVSNGWKPENPEEMRFKWTSPLTYFYSAQFLFLELKLSFERKCNTLYSYDKFIQSYVRGKLLLSSIKKIFK